MVGSGHYKKAGRAVKKEHSNEKGETKTKQFGEGNR